jgi:hypothetical protein
LHFVVARLPPWLDMKFKSTSSLMLGTLNVNVDYSNWQWSLMQWHACPPQFDTNPFTKMWWLVTTSHILIISFPKYVKLAKLAMVQLVGNVDDDRCFSILAFMKYNHHSRLTTHSSLVVQCFYTIQSLLYEECGELPAITIAMMSSMWSTIFWKELRGPSKGYHFFVPIDGC